MGMKPQHFYTILHLVLFYHHLHKYALYLLVVCRGGLWKAVGWVVQSGYVLHVDMHGE